MFGVCKSRVASNSMAALMTAVGLVSAGGLSGCDGPQSARVDSTAQPREPEVSSANTGTGVGETTSAVSDYENALRTLSAQIDAARARAESMTSQTTPLDRLTQLYLARARLSGSLDDYIAAEETLDRALSDATNPDAANVGSTIQLTRARVLVTLHRVFEAERVLGALPRQPVDLNFREPTADSIRGDVFLQTGRYEEAVTAYEASFAVLPSATVAFQLAQAHAATGDWATAEQWMDDGEQRIVGENKQNRAFFALHRGLFDLARGRYASARRHYQRADAAFSGWWLIEEHIAEIDAIEGNLENAIRTYRRLVRDTEDPEFMDALADALRTQADEASRNEADTWTTRAREEYERRLAKLPEATYGHALDHFLSHGPPSRAAELARRNAALRPSGEALVQLATAEADVGELLRATEVIEQVLSSGYRSAELHATAARIYSLAGDQSQADHQRALAIAIRPDIFDL